MSHRTTLSDLIAAIAKNMTTAELAKAVVNIQIQQMIHDTRMAKGWAQKDLADKMGVKQSLVSRWESGDCNYTMILSSGFKGHCTDSPKASAMSIKVSMV